MTESSTKGWIDPLSERLVSAGVSSADQVWLFIHKDFVQRWMYIHNTLRPNKVAAISQTIISLMFVSKGPINNIPSLVQIMAWGRPGDKPLSNLMLVSLLTQICVTRPQWVNALYNFQLWRWIGMSGIFLCKIPLHDIRKNNTMYNDLPSYLYCRRLSHWWLMLPKIFSIVPGGYDRFHEFKFWAIFHLDNCDTAYNIVLYWMALYWAPA